MGGKPSSRNAYRRDDRGLTRVDLWLDPRSVLRLDKIVRTLVADSRSDAIRYAIDATYESIEAEEKNKLA